jgi:hypothetical protein
MTAPSPPSTTSDLEAARHLIGLGEGFGTGRAARRLQGERAMARRQWDDAEAALCTALSTAQEIGSPAQLWKTHAAFTRLYAGQGKADESERPAGGPSRPRERPGALTQSRTPSEPRSSHQTGTLLMMLHSAGLG